MNEKTYHYTDPHFLNKLVMSISPERCALTAYMYPDVEEFIELAQKKPSWDYHFYNQLSAEAMQFWKDYTVHMISLCQKHDIHPFWGLLFEYDYRQFEEPKISFAGFSHDGTTKGEPRKTLVHPALFAEERKWYSISFVNAKGKESVERVQQAIVGFIEQGYRVTSLKANLNPRTESRGTCEDAYDAEVSDARLWAHDGTVTIQGDVSFDFDEIRKMPQKQPAPLLLEEVLKNVLL